MSNSSNSTFQILIDRKDLYLKYKVSDAPSVVDSNVQCDRIRILNNKLQVFYCLSGFLVDDDSDIDVCCDEEGDDSDIDVCCDEEGDERSEALFQSDIDGKVLKCSVYVNNANNKPRVPGVAFFFWRGWPGVLRQSSDVHVVEPVSWIPVERNDKRLFLTNATLNTDASIKGQEATFYGRLKVDNTLVYLDQETRKVYRRIAKFPLVDPFFEQSTYLDNMEIMQHFSNEKSDQIKKDYVKELLQHQKAAELKNLPVQERIGRQIQDLEEKIQNNDLQQEMDRAKRLQLAQNVETIKSEIIRNKEKLRQLEEEALELAGKSNNDQAGELFRESLNIKKQIITEFTRKQNILEKDLNKKNEAITRQDTIIKDRLSEKTELEREIFDKREEEEKIASALATLEEAKEDLIDARNTKDLAANMLYDISIYTALYNNDS